MDARCSDKTNAISEMRKKASGQFNKINAKAKQKETTQDRSESVLLLTLGEKSNYLTQIWFSEVGFQITKMKCNEMKTEVIHSDKELRI